MKKLSIVLAFITLAGCEDMNPNNRTLIALQNPETQQTVQCRSRVGAGAMWNPYTEVEACAKSYEKAGFKRVAAY